MLWIEWRIVAVSICVFLSFAGTAEARKLNAGAILQNMSAGERFTYLAGVIEGLAHPRSEAGAACLYRWFYDNAENRRKLEAAFQRHPEQDAAPIIIALTRRDCGAS